VEKEVEKGGKKGVGARRIVLDNANGEEQIYRGKAAGNAFCGGKQETLKQDQSVPGREGGKGQTTALTRVKDRCGGGQAV